MDRVAIVRVVYKGGAKVDCNAIYLCWMDSASDSISALNDSMIDMLLVEYFGGGDAGCTCPDNDNIMDGCLYIVGQCCEYYSQK